MPDMERDFWPPPIYTCKECDREFEADYIGQRLCPECQHWLECMEE